jgi:hypothetical protein
VGLLIDSLQFSVDDLGHKGCIAPTVSSIGTGSVPIIVTGVTSKLAIKAPGALYVLEDSVLAFTNNGCPPTKARSCSALQVNNTPSQRKRKLIVNGAIFESDWLDSGAVHVPSRAVSP